MSTRPELDAKFVMRLLPGSNPDSRDRREAWNEWQTGEASAALLRFIRFYNNTAEPDEDILQDALLTAYLEVERGRYERRAGVPFTAYVKGIARNKIREARRRERGQVSLDELHALPEEAGRQIEQAVERREQSRALHQGLEQLPGPRRLVLERFICGESTAEIAAGLEISEELVRQHKCRGLRRLQQLSVVV
jgi:RNA polymerase sigma factor (sigma-70 family)